MRLLLTLFAVTALGGCAAPPLLTFASATLTGASYIATGKGPADHALSFATRRECDFWRAFRERPFSPICRYERETAVGRSAPAPQLAAADPKTRIPGIAGRAPAADNRPVIPPEAAEMLRVAVMACAWSADDAVLAASLTRDPARAAAFVRARDRAAEDEIAAAVIASIARYPRAVSAIVGVAVDALPEHRAAIVARASAAFPGFAADIRRAARPLSAPPVAAGSVV